MVKGISRRVIVMRFPDPQPFEEAIFIVSGEASPGVTQETLLLQAQEVAANYVRQEPRHRKRRPLPRFLWALMGAAPVAAAWAAAAFL